MSVNDDDIPTKSSPPALIGSHVMTILRHLALAETVDVDDGTQIVQTEPGGSLRRFPNRALGRLTVSK